MAFALAGDMAVGQDAKPRTVNETGKVEGGPPGSEEKKEIKKKGKGKFTISKETTYVTGPLDKDGYIDYAAALNERLKKGVTPENNANVLIWKALGPHPKRYRVPEEYFQLLGMEAPPEKGEYFKDFWSFVKDRYGIGIATEGYERLYGHFNHDIERPWSAREHREVADWVKANEQALATAVHASGRPQYYGPSVQEKRTGASIRVYVLGVREIANALVARAMLRLNEKNYDEAWQDLLACHRLGRLISRGASLLNALVNISIDGVAARAEVAYLDGIRSDPKRVENCLRDLQKLPPLQELADKLDVCDRFNSLGLFMRYDRHENELRKFINIFLRGWTAEKGHEEDDKVLDLIGKLTAEDIDRDAAMRNVNRWHDRMAAMTRGTTRASREKQWEEIQEEAKALRKAIEPGELSKILEGKDNAEVRAKLVTDLWFCFVVSGVHRTQNSTDYAKQNHENLIVAFALAWYQCDHGHFPKSLDALAPKYLAEIPQDIFSGKPLIYHPTNKGFVLYSVGLNGKDDGGRGHDDDVPGDDIVIRMPLPEWKSR